MIITFIVLFFVLLLCGWKVLVAIVLGGFILSFILSQFEDKFKKNDEFNPTIYVMEEPTPSPKKEDEKVKKKRKKRKTRKKGEKNEKGEDKGKIKGR